MGQNMICVLAAAVAAAVVASPVWSQPADSAATAAAQAISKVLAEGDAAPSLGGITWLKGTPVEQFEAGRVYIVEIWATWCGPCKRGIPHLTELQAKHQDKLTVIGISCWERAEDAQTRVSVARSFVESQGAAMEYTCAADGDGVIVKGWMQPAGRRSIPSAFIVDGHGNIAWMGNPLSGMDAVLERVLAGGFDAKAEAEKAKLVAAAKRVKDELFARANLLAQQEKYEEALQLMDQALGIEQDPAIRIPMIRQKLRMLLKFDEARAYSLARSMLEGEMKDNDFGLYTLATSIMQMPGLKATDHRLVADLMVRSAELAEPSNYAAQETLGQALFRAGDVDGAIAAGERAMEIMRSPGTTASAAAQQRVLKQVEEYKGSAGGRAEEK